MISSLLHLVGLRPRVYYTLTNFRGGGQGPLGPPPQYANVYNLRPHALALPRIYHVYAESCPVYQLVKLYNDTTYDPLILRKIEEKSFKQYVTASLLDKYSQNKICNIPDCYSCKR